MAREELSIVWIRSLAEPYLRGYRAVPQRRGSLRGYWFARPRPSRLEKRKPGPHRPRRAETAVGFFVGYLVSEQGYAFLEPEPPECVVFAFVHPVGGPAHRRLVRQPGSLLRRTFEYIRWLTHRPPRFAFYERGAAAMVRHLSMRDWPRVKYKHFSRNFFIETLAWVVRSGLARRLLAEVPRPGVAGQVTLHAPSQARRSLYRKTPSR